MSSLFEMKTRTTGHNSNYSLHKKKNVWPTQGNSSCFKLKVWGVSNQAFENEKAQPRNVFFRYEKNRIK